jgi:hypothetical protein
MISAALRKIKITQLLLDKKSAACSAILNGDKYSPSQTIRFSRALPK